MVKRYDFELDHRMYEERQYIREDENPHGDWVKHSDYAELAERCERLEAALRALVDYDSEAHNDTSLLDNGPLWDQADAALSEKSQ